MGTILFKLAVNAENPAIDVEDLQSNIESTLESNYDFTSHENDAKADGYLLTHVERSGPRMEIVHHDDHPKCIRMYDSQDPLFDIWPDGLITPMGSAPFDTTQMELAIAISKNFKFFYNSL